MQRDLAEDHPLTKNKFIQQFHNLLVSLTAQCDSEVTSSYTNEWVQI